MGLAFQRHHDALSFFPSGGNEWWTPPTYSGGQPATGRQQDASWAFQILPYIEADTIWKGVGSDDQSRSISAIAAMIPTYFCPAAGPQTVKYTSSTTYIAPTYSLSGELTHGLMDYAGCNLEGTGVLVRSGSDLLIAPRRMSDVTDGTTSTLAVAEKRLNLRYLGQRQQDDNEGYSARLGRRHRPRHQEQTRTRLCWRCRRRRQVWFVAPQHVQFRLRGRLCARPVVWHRCRGLQCPRQHPRRNGCGRQRFLGRSRVWTFATPDAQGHPSGRHCCGSLASSSAAMSTASVGVSANRTAGVS